MAQNAFGQQGQIDSPIPPKASFRLRMPCGRPENSFRPKTSRTSSQLLRITTSLWSKLIVKMSPCFFRMASNFINRSFPNKNGAIPRNGRPHGPKNTRPHLIYNNICFQSVHHIGLLVRIVTDQKIHILVYFKI